MQFLGFMSFALNFNNEIAKIPWNSRNIYEKYIYKEISENWHSRKSSNETLLVFKAFFFLQAFFSIVL